jgi:hypothetical protein
MFSFVVVDLKQFAHEFKDNVFVRVSAERGCVPHPIGHGSMKEKVIPALKAEIEQCPFADENHPAAKCYCLELLAALDFEPVWGHKKLQASLFDPQ